MDLEFYDHQGNMSDKFGIYWREFAIYEYSGNDVSPERFQAYAAGFLYHQSVKPSVKFLKTGNNCFPIDANTNYLSFLCVILPIHFDNNVKLSREMKFQSRCARAAHFCLWP